MKLGMTEREVFGPPPLATHGSAWDSLSVSRESNANRGTGLHFR
jgi:hypothetical protein